MKDKVWVCVMYYVWVDLGWCIMIFFLIFWIIEKKNKEEGGILVNSLFIVFKSICLCFYGVCIGWLWLDSLLIVFLLMYGVIGGLFSFVLSVWFGIELILLWCCYFECGLIGKL